jgi:hypothetical protein
MGADYRGYPTNDHGKLRIQFFDLPATSVAGDAGTTIDLCKLPFGRQRILPSMSRLKHSAFGSSRTLKVGHLAYSKTDDSIEGADDDALTPSPIDVSSAGNNVVLSASLLKFDIFSKAGVTIQALVEGGTIPLGATLSGYIVYVSE